MSTKYRRRAICRYRLFYDSPDNLRLSATRNRRNNRLHPKQRRHSEGDGGCRYILEALEPAFGHLLPPGDIIQLDDLYIQWIVKIRLGRIVKRQVPVFP